MGINNSGLKIIGKVNCKICINDAIRENLSQLVVPNMTMKTSVVLGRDVLDCFGYSLTSVEEGIKKILNIGFC